MAVLAGIFSLFPTACYNTFGKKHGPHIYTLVILGSPSGSLYDTMLVQFFFKFGVQYLFYAAAVNTFIASLVCY